MPIPFPKRPDGIGSEALFGQFSHDALSHVLRLQKVSGFRMQNSTQGLALIPDSDQGPDTGIKSYRLFDVLDDYLVCVAPPSMPPPAIGQQPLGRPQVIGSFSDDDLDDDMVRLVLDPGNPDADPPIDPTFYDPVAADCYFNTDQKLWFAFDGIEWVNMVGELRFTGDNWQRFDGQIWNDLNSLPAIYVAKEPKHRTSLQAERLLDQTHTYTYDDGDSELWQVATDMARSGHYNLLRHDFDGTSTEDQRIVPPWTEGEIIQAVRHANTGVTRPASDDEINAGIPDPVVVGLHIFGRSSQWCQIA